MSLISFIKGLLGGESETAELPVNDTVHEDPHFDNLPGNLFKQELEKHPNAVLLDVRTPMELRSGALPKALNIDFMSSSFAREIAALDKSKTYFIYCRSGNRSAQACQLMFKKGFDVRNLMGGIGAFPR